MGWGAGDPSAVPFVRKMGWGSNTETGSPCLLVDARAFQNQPGQLVDILTEPEDCSRSPRLRRLLFVMAIWQSSGPL